MGLLRALAQPSTRYIYVYIVYLPGRERDGLLPARTLSTVLAYKLAHENPAVKTALDQKIQEMEQVENSDNIYKGPILKSLNEEKEGFEKQLTDVHDKCLQHLLEEEVKNVKS